MCLVNDDVAEDRSRPLIMLMIQWSQQDQEGFKALALPYNMSTYYIYIYIFAHTILIFISSFVEC